MALVLCITIKQLQGTQNKQSENRPGDIAVSNLAQDSGIALFSIRNINCARLQFFETTDSKAATGEWDSATTMPVICIDSDYKQTTGQYPTFRAFEKCIVEKHTFLNLYF